MKYIILINVLFFTSCSSVVQRAPANINSCSELVDHFFEKDQSSLKLSRESIELSEKDVKKYSNMYNDYLKHRRLMNGGGTYIGQDGKVYTMGKPLEVKFPEDEYWTSLYVFSDPVKIHGESTVHVKLWSRNGKYFGTKNNVLENIPTARLWNMVRKSYPEYTLKEGQIILLPSVKKRNRGHSVSEAWTLLEKGKKTAKITNGLGETKWIPYEEIFYSNIGIKSAEQELIEKFIKQGGKGEFIRYIETNPKLAGMTGIYIRVHELPPYKDISELKGIVRDERVYNRLQKSLDDKIAIHLTTTGRGFGGFHSNKKTTLANFLKNRYRLRVRENSIIITNKADVGTVHHELVHLDDDVNELVEGLKGWLEELQRLHQLPLENKDLIKVRAFILEQRAYSIEIDFLRDLIKQSPSDETLREFADKTIERSKNTFNDYYKAELHKIINDLDEGSFKSELIKRIKELLNPSDELFY